MPSDNPAPAVLVRVQPRLLNDALCLVLGRAGFAVSACPVVERRLAPRTPRCFDVALVTVEAPADAACGRVITIDEDGSVLGPTGTPVDPPGLDRLLAEVHRALDVSERPGEGSEHLS